MKEKRIEAWTLIVCFGLAVMGALGAAANRAR